MPRVCNRANCGQLLLNSDGTPSFRKHFCSRECLNADNKERKQLRRGATGKRCPLCGQKPATKPCVSADAAASERFQYHIVPTTKDGQIAPLPNPQ